MRILKYYQKQDKPVHKYNISEGNSGIDLKAAIFENIIIPPGEWRLIPTNLYLEIPENYEGQVRGRSGLGLKHGISIVQGIGTIDAAYRGEIGVLLLNNSKSEFIVSNGDRIAQLVICEVSKMILKKVESYDGLSETSRGSDGFGSTGIK